MEIWGFDESTRPKSLHKLLTLTQFTVYFNDYSFMFTFLFWIFFVAKTFQIQRQVVVKCLHIVFKQSVDYWESSNADMDIKCKNTGDLRGSRQLSHCHTTTTVLNKKTLHGQLLKTKPVCFIFRRRHTPSPQLTVLWVSFSFITMPPTDLYFSLLTNLIFQPSHFKCTRYISVFAVPNNQSGKMSHICDILLLRGCKMEIHPISNPLSGSLVKSVSHVVRDQTIRSS